MLYNQNSGYGRALLDRVASILPVFGRVHVVMNVTSDSADPNFIALQEIMLADPTGRIRFYTDLATAYAAVATNNNDVILLEGHTSHKVTSMLTIDKNRTHFIGMDSGGRQNNQRCLISNTGAGAATDVSMIKVTGTGNTFRNIKFSNNWTVAQNLSAMLDYSNNSLFENCSFHNLGSAHLTNANAAPLILAGGDSLYRNCTIGEDTLQSTVASGQALLIKKGTSAQAATRVVFDRCWFAAYTNKTTHAFVRVAADGDIDRNVHFKQCTFHNFYTSSNGALMAVAVASASGLVSGTMLFEYPAVMGATDLATAAVGNAGVFVIGTTATAGSDGISVLATA